MSLERNRLKKLVDEKDLDGICRWVDEVVHSVREGEKPTLQVSSADQGFQCGLNLFGLKLAAESWPHVLESLSKLQQPLDARVTLVLAAKDAARTRVRITLETVSDELMPGQGAL